MLAASGLCAIFPAAAAVTTPGALDQPFGGNAVATVPVTISFDLAYGATGAGAQYVTGVAYRGATVREQPDGKVLVAGTDHLPNQLLWRNSATGQGWAHRRFAGARLHRAQYAVEDSRSV